jgi:hypothetical protein
MSYDLYFRFRSGGKSLSHGEFKAYFRERPLWRLEPLQKMKGSQAWYFNERTGVYFLFEYAERVLAPDVEDEADASLLPVSFNLNYFRPHPFGLEAEPEVAAFVARFDLSVSDPQASGMGEGQYSRDGFLRGWNAGNAFGYGSILSQDLTQKLLTLPAAAIRALWRWNYDCERRQAKIGDAVFVPRIFFFDVDGEVRTGATWGDGIPILLPRVDLVLVPRKRFPPRRWFRRGSDIVVFTWEELAPVVEHYSKAAGKLESYELFYEAPPPEIEQIVREKVPPEEMPKGAAFDQVLDRELVDQARRRPSGGA